MEFCFYVLDVPAEESVLWMEEGSMRSHGQRYVLFLLNVVKLRAHTLFNSRIKRKHLCWNFCP